MTATSSLSLLCVARMIYSTMVESLDYFDPFPGYFFLNALLLVLQALHIFWAYLILRMVHKFVFQGKVMATAVLQCFHPMTPPHNMTHTRHTTFCYRDSYYHVSVATAPNKCRTKGWDLYQHTNDNSFNLFIAFLELNLLEYQLLKAGLSLCRLTPI